MKLKPFPILLSHSFVFRCWYLKPRKATSVNMTRTTSHVVLGTHILPLPVFELEVNINYTPQTNQCLPLVQFEP